MKEKLKEKKGITLIALVITIIVLLILAGVTIATLTGDNGILTRAGKAQEETEIGEIKERVKTEIAERQVENQKGNIGRAELKEILDKYFENVPENYGSETEITAKAEYGNHKMKVSEIYSGALIVTSQDIVKTEDKSEYYGKEVKGYELPSGTTTDVKWKIFYADESSIYLIADNYVERANLPNSTTGEGGTIEGADHKPNDGNSSYPRTAHFSNILPDYAGGSARIIDKKLKKLNNTYFYKIENEKEVDNFTSTNNNMKSVAYMMDTKAWNSKFKDIKNKAEYVIGGPTVELLFKSYNDKYKTSYESQATNATGYQIRKTSNDSWANYVGEMLKTSDPLYVISATSDALAYWVASPSATNTNSVMHVYYNGGVNNNDFTYNNVGYRPLVCLKSDIQLQKNADDTYTIL